MKVLLLSVSTGQGHHQTAMAAMDSLRVRGVDCEMLDIYEYISPRLSESIAKGYLISTQFSPFVYGKLYRLAEKKEKSDTKFSIARLTNEILSHKLTSYIDNYDPDVIVCTHVLSGHLVTHMRDKGRLQNTKLVGIVTDFAIHPFWEDTVLDYYITASHLLNNQLKKKQIPLEKVMPLGIPVAEKFSSRTDRAAARAALGLEDKMTVLLMSGSMGYGNMVKVIKQIDQLDMDFQIISVCGHNMHAKEKIDQLQTRKRVINYGYVNNVDQLMDASNCIITKPGGITVSESLAKGLPIIIINPIPGQEDRNVEFLTNNGLALKVTPTFPIDEAIFQMLSNEWRQVHSDSMIHYIGKPRSAADFAEFVISLKRAEG